MIHQIWKGYKTPFCRSSHKYPPKFIVHAPSGEKNGRQGKVHACAVATGVGKKGMSKVQATLNREKSSPES